MWRILTIVLLLVVSRAAVSAAPVIDVVGVSPGMVAKGGTVHIVVQATADMGVFYVDADGMWLSYIGGGYWEGDITAPDAAGQYTITLTAADDVGDKSTDMSATYTVAPVFATSCRGVKDPIMAAACHKNLYKLCGKVVIVDSDSFWIEDGSSARVLVLAPGCNGFNTGDCVSACGVLDPLANPPTLDCAPDGIVCYTQTPPQPSPAPMTLTWNPSLYSYGANLRELQIYRDPELASPTDGPFYVISNPLMFAQGRVDLTPIYEAGSVGLGHTVNYNDIAPGGRSLVPFSLSWPAEGYGDQHTYELMAIVTTTGPGGTTYSYDWNSFGGAKKMTCIEPVTNDANHIVSPMDGDPVLVSSLRSGDTNLCWNAVYGATDYMVTVEPVEPGIGPAWHSNIMYHIAGSGDVVCLSDSDRLSLARLLAGPQYVDKDIKWRVDARNYADDPLCWTPGGWYPATTCVFHLQPTPGPPP